MALGISIDRDEHRFDSETFPFVTLTDFFAPGAFKIGHSVYKNLPTTLGSTFTFRPPNTSIKDCPIAIRRFETGSWTITPLVGITGTADVDGFIKNIGGTEGWHGAHSPAASATKSSIQATAMSLTLSAGISMQNSDVAIEHNYFDSDVTHSIILGQGGVGSIREQGVLVPQNASFRYEVGDSVMIELEDGLVRYFLIKADQSVRLLRTTRSKLTAAPQYEVMLYFIQSQLTNVFLFDGDEATDTIDLIGVLENFQDWQNDFIWSSTADAITLANNDSEFTFANSKTRIRSLTPNLNMRQKSQRDDFLDFFLHHGGEKEFIFRDLAHTDRDREATDFWARFTAGFGDKTRASCLSIHASQITETYRNDVVLKQEDAGVLTVNLDEPFGSAFQDRVFFGNFTITTTGRLAYLDIYIDGALYRSGQEVDNIGKYFTFTVEHDDLANGSHDIYVIGYTYGGQSDQSPTWSFSIA